MRERRIIPAGLRLLLCLLCAACLMGFGISTKAYAFEAKLGSGTDGAISWEAWNYDFEWTLKITGSGRMKDYIASGTYGSSGSVAPWFGTYDGIQLERYRKIEIGRGITYIGAHAFDCQYTYYNYIKEVKIPDSVTEIGDYAFAGQRDLRSVVIPNSVTKIGKDVFWHTSGSSPVIICRSDSEAFRYAKENNLQVQLTDLTIALTIDSGKTGVTLTQGDTISYEVTLNVPGITPVFSDENTISTPAPVPGAPGKFRGTYTAVRHGITYNLTCSAYRVTSNPCKITIRRELTVDYVEDLSEASAGEDLDYIDNSVNPTHFTAGTTLTLKAPKRKGYTFLGWAVQKWISAQRCFQFVEVKKLTDKDSLKVYGFWEKTSVNQAKKPTLANKKSKKMTISWKKVSGAKGYQVQWSNKSNFKSSVKSKNLKGNKLTVSKLTKKKTYYVRVRAYKTDSTDAKVYGAWSKKAKLKITK